MGDAQDVTRRRVLQVVGAAGLGGTLLPGVLLGMVAESAPAQAAAGADGQAASGSGVPPMPPITAGMIDAAATIAGVVIAPEHKAMMLEGLNDQRDALVEIRRLDLQNATAPAFVFDPVVAGEALDTIRRPIQMSTVTAGFTDRGSPDANAEELAFKTVRELAELLRTGRVTSMTLTRMYLARLKRYDATLKFVINLTEERALRQAAEADAEIAAGRYRGPLHGIPWGAKDLLAVAGYPTTWGAAGFMQQTFPYDAEVVKRLDAAGAVLVAKLAMGALAQGDLWGWPVGSGKAGGRCRNPWNPQQGSSGSSAGSASAVAAGCVGFAIGTETLGSISSPSTRCGATGLRPSFGLVPRTGAMALSWTMDKIGPIARCVEDCALVLSAIYGPDGKDRSVQPASFNWNAAFDWRGLRVGFLESSFAERPARETAVPAGGEDDASRARAERARAESARRSYDLRYARATLDVLRGKMGLTLAPVELPRLPFEAMVPLLEAEAGAAFDELLRSGGVDLLAGQKEYDWPNQFRVVRFYPAVDYIQAQRARMLALEAMHGLFQQVDVVVTPSAGLQLVATNLTGQPAVIVPNGIRGVDAPPSPDHVDGAVDNAGGPGTPVSITFLGGLYKDAQVAALARAYQDAAGFQALRPELV